MPTLRLAMVAVLAGLLIQAPAAATAPSRQDAERFQRKIQQIVINGERPSPGAARRTPFSEAEVNAYLRYDAVPLLPAGVTAPSVALLGDDRLEGRLVVDVDAINQQRHERPTLDPLRYVSGKVPVTFVGRLQARNGVGRFELETATVSGVPIPGTLVQELLTYYSRSPEHPQGVRLDGEFELPLGIREIRAEGRGHAVVVQ